MTPLSAFRSRIAPRVPTALDMTIDQAVLDAAIDFCEQTLICKGTLDQLTTAAGAREYQIDAASNDQKVVKIMRAWLQQRELNAVAEDDVDSPFAYADRITGVTNSTSVPHAFTEPAPGFISLIPTPDGAYPITIRAAMKPTRSATQVDDVLYENWAEEIVHGALYRLHSMPGMPFTNDAQAATHMALYRLGVNKALLEATRGRTRAERVMRIPRI